MEKPIFQGSWDPQERSLGIHFLAALDPWIYSPGPYFVELRRESVLRDAPDHAPGHSKYEPRTGVITIYDKGARSPEQLGRSIYHELAHVVVKRRPEILKRWVRATRGDGAVDEYAERSADEDFADTFSEALLHPREVAKKVPRKFAFLQQFFAGQEKRAMFTEGFVDEMIKCANKTGFLRSPLAKIIGVGAAGTGTYAAGRHGGAKSTKEKVSKHMPAHNRAVFQAGQRHMLQQIQRRMQMQQQRR